MQISDLATQMHERFNRLEELILAKKASRSEKPTQESSRNLIRPRIETIETFFWKMINSPRAVRRDTYKFPRVLIEHPTKPPLQGMVLSVLINQIAMRKVFKLQGEGDPRGASAREKARLAVEASNLVVLAVRDTSLESFSETLVAFSPGEALRIAKSTAPIPREFVGWTTKDRALSQRGPAGLIQPPDDPCFARDWGHDAPEEDFGDDVPEIAAEAPVEDVEPKERKPWKFEL